jgi:hypothetical protein
MRKMLTQPKVITLILILQLIPLILFPASSFSPNTQEWWLPVVLAVLAFAGVFQLTFRHSMEGWPWYLIGFAQGFNIISRLMMLMPHATYNNNGVQVFNSVYFTLSTIAMLLSAFMLWYIEWPEVRMKMTQG